MEQKINSTPSVLSENVEQNEPSEWVQSRIAELIRADAKEFNKSNLVGKTYSSFFAPNQVLYPGHNEAGFVLDDNEPYEKMYQMLKEHPSHNDLPALIFMADWVKNQYFLPEDLSNMSRGSIREAYEKGRDWRQEVFYDPDNSNIYSIRDLKTGAYCTEQTALMHNIVQMCGIKSLYCVDGFIRSGVDINSTDADHASIKHSFLLVKDSDSGELFIYDPNDYSLVKQNKTIAIRPLLFPINSQTSELNGQSLTLRGEYSGYDPNKPRKREVQYTISNFPKCAIVMGKMGLISELSDGARGVLSVR